ncbi:MAG: small ribosomal subunit Rsm22 family protein [Anaerolineae bacterium]
MEDFNYLYLTIESLAEKLTPKDLKAASEDLSFRYRENREKGVSFIHSEAAALAYLVARFPATLAVIEQVLTEFSKRISLIDIESVLDLGAGPGSGFWAVHKVLTSHGAVSNLKKITLIEKESRFIALGRQILKEHASSLQIQPQWRQEDFSKLQGFESHDLVLLSYSFGEILPNAREELVAKAWQASAKILVIIEPGTPFGFERIRTARKQLLELGAHLVAPCPHSGCCPMKEGDWCHFSKRLDRSRLHRFVKNAEKNFEDEKFSYLVVSKQPSSLPAGRILRHPLKHQGHVSLVLCSSDQTLKQRIISRKDKELFRKARKAQWGEEI